MAKMEQGTLGDQIATKKAALEIAEKKLADLAEKGEELGKDKLELDALAAEIKKGKTKKTEIVEKKKTGTTKINDLSALGSLQDEILKDVPEEKPNPKTQRKNTKKITTPVLHSEKLVDEEKNPVIDEKIDREASIEEVAELLKNNKISQVVIAGEMVPDQSAKIKDPKSKEKIFALKPDLDAETAMYLLNNFNKKTLEETYAPGAMTSLIEKSGEGQDLIEKGKSGKMHPSLENQKEEKKIKINTEIGRDNKDGLKVFIDVGGNWLKLEKDGKTTTIYIDHHGAGKREPTSGTRMMRQIMEKAGILEDAPAWMNKLTGFVNNIDNLSYLEKTERGRKTFDETFFRNEWPNSLYAIAEKHIPFDTLVDLLKSGKIKDPNRPFTKEELEGEIGSFKIGKFTIKELCVQQKKEVDYTLTSISAVNFKNKKDGLDLNNTSLGKIVYNNYSKTWDGKINKILDHLAFKAVKAKRESDTYISWNNHKDQKKFFINSNHDNLSEIVRKLNEADPGCANDVRGVMVFGKINNLTEEQFLNIIDPKILQGSEERKKQFAEGKKTATSKKPEAAVGTTISPDKEKEDITTTPEDAWTPEDETAYNEALKEIEEAEKIITEEKEKNIKREERLREIDARLAELDEEEKLLLNKEKNPSNLEEEWKKHLIESSEKGVKGPNKIFNNFFDEQEKIKRGENLKNDTDNKESKEVKTYSMDFVKEKITEVLQTLESVKKIVKLEITGDGDEILINAEIKAEGKIGIFKKNADVLIAAHITNDGDKIAIKDSQISAGILTPIVKSKITPKLSELSEIIKSYIEKETKTKVEKVWIENDELKAL